ncbi:hypothetical protein [Gordonia otitidis]|nr:hypothetical protein [Gordonia otitidis]
MSSAPRRPRRAGLFTRMSKSFTDDMLASGVTIEAAGLYTMISTDRAVNALGYVYRKHEWEEFPGANSDTIDRLLNLLEKHGHIVAAGYHIVIRGYVRRNAFEFPSYLRSGLYDLQRAVTHPLLRCVIGSEFLRLDTRGWDDKKTSNVWLAANAIWQEITDGATLPPAHHLRGEDSISATMLDSLATMPEAERVYAELDARQWSVIAEHLRQPLQAAFQHHHHSNTVTQLARRTAT